MAFFVDSNKTLRDEIKALLTARFGADKLEFKEDGHKLYIRVAKNAGSPTQEFRLTQEEVDAGVCGGGTIEGLDGKDFCITISQLPDLQKALMECEKWRMTDEEMERLMQ